MKNKLIMVGLAVMLVVALLFAFAMPAMSPDADVGTAGITAEAADLAVADSGTVLVVDSVPWTPAAIAGYMWCVWLIPGVILLTTLVFRRKLSKLLHFVASDLRRNRSTDEGTEVGGGPNKFILPVAA